MTTRLVVGSRNQAFHWLDVVDPSPAELEQVARDYGLHPTSIQDCLDPEHLPKYEKIGDIVFMIMRSYDEACADEADTVQELTRKVAIFVGSNFVITVHRKDQPFMIRLKERWAEMPADTNYTYQLLADLLGRIFNSFEGPVDRALTRLETLETQIFRSESGPQLIEEAYFIKRRASVVKRMLRMSIEILPKVFVQNGVSNPLYQDLKDAVDSLFFYADELLESVNGLVNLHVSLSSQRTNEASHRSNEVMRVLTVFSIFFMPLNFIAGIYGMNFEHMPELKTSWGYPVVLLSMGLITGAIYLWARRKGWIR